MKLARARVQLKGIEQEPEWKGVFSGPPLEKSPCYYLTPPTTTKKIFFDYTSTLCFSRRRHCSVSFLVSRLSGYFLRAFLHKSNLVSHCRLTGSFELRAGCQRAAPV